MGKKIKLRKQMRDKLRKLWEQGKGVSKHAVMGEHNRSPYIHSYNTYCTYDKWVNKFASWCKEHDITTWNAAREAVGQYLTDGIRTDDGTGETKKGEVSAATVRTVAAALGKVFDCSINDFGIEIPSMTRAAIKRSRYAAERDKHVSLIQNEEIIEFCRSTGLRRSELEDLTGVIRHKDGTTEPRIIHQDGKTYLKVRGKGGKWREAEILGDEKQVRRVVQRIENAHESLVWSHVHTKIDVHGYRAEYACSMYLKYARDTEVLQHEDRYYCRGDRAGCCYDREAMLIASQSLGHERVSVIASNYLWGLK